MRRREAGLRCQFRHSRFDVRQGFRGIGAVGVSVEHDDVTRRVAAGGNHHPGPGGERFGRRAEDAQHALLFGECGFQGGELRRALTDAFSFNHNHRRAQHTGPEPVGGEVVALVHFVARWQPAHHRVAQGQMPYSGRRNAEGCDAEDHRQGRKAYGGADQSPAGTGPLLDLLGMLVLFPAGSARPEQSPPEDRQ